ncbi:hypothetical protein L6R29_12505 [Myxococcota bacterium]|nr:hypothetical protein [Myxococcota bacterium]
MKSLQTQIPLETAQKHFNTALRDLRALAWLHLLIGLFYGASLYTNTLKIQEALFPITSSAFLFALFLFTVQKNSTQKTLFSLCIYIQIALLGLALLTLSWFLVAFRLAVWFSLHRGRAALDTLQEQEYNEAHLSQKWLHQTTPSSL